MNGTKVLGIVVGLWVLLRSVVTDSSGRTLVDHILGNSASKSPLLNFNLPTSTTAGGSGLGTGSYSALAGKGLTFAGPDQGIDFTGRGTVYAPATSKVVSQKANSGWPGEGNLTVLQFLSGPQSGKYWYIAEDFQPSVGVGSTVQAGQPIGLASGSGKAPGIEVGFAQNAAGAAYGTPNMGKPGGPTPTFGQAFGNFIQSLAGGGHG